MIVVSIGFSLSIPRSRSGTYYLVQHQIGPTGPILSPYDIQEGHYDGISFSHPYFDILWNHFQVIQLLLFGLIKCQGAKTFRHTIQPILLRALPTSPQLTALLHDVSLRYLLGQTLTFFRQALSDACGLFLDEDGIRRRLLGRFGRMSGFRRVTLAAWHFDFH